MAETAYAGTLGTAETVTPPSGGISAEHTRLVQSSYNIIKPALDLVATLFFRRLIEIEPRLRPMLAGGMDEQRRQLLSALALSVASLDRFDQIVPALQLMGTKYRGLGIEEFHYGAAGEALLWTLKQSLGPHWSSDIEDAWAAAFTAIAEAMTGLDESRQKKARGE